MLDTIYPWYNFEKTSRSYARARPYIEFTSYARKNKISFITPNLTRYLIMK